MMTFMLSAVWLFGCTKVLRAHKGEELILVKSRLSEINDLLQMYRVENGKFPDDFQDLRVVGIDKFHLESKNKTVHWEYSSTPKEDGIIVKSNVPIEGRIVFLKSDGYIGSERAEEIMK